MNEAEWTPFVSLTPRKLVSGEVTRATATLLMRRKKNGAWEYRWPTAEEARNYADAEAW